MRSGSRHRTRVSRDRRSQYCAQNHVRITCSPRETAIPSPGFYNTYASWAQWTQGVAISAAVLAATSFVLDWLVNRDKADPGPPVPLLRVPTETP
jgi:negative regulator of sigma E activity